MMDRMRKGKRIYMDHAATTPVDKDVLKTMTPYFSEKFGNASSIHGYGQDAKQALEASRTSVAKLIGAQPDEIIFTSGGTESDNLAVRGAALAEKERSDKNHIITSKIEHDAVLHAVEQLGRQGFDVTVLTVDKHGLVNPADVEKAITAKTCLVSIMFANNEIGTIQPIAEIGRICREKGVLFHTDAVQAYGKLPIDVKKLNVDMLSASAHKLYGPKGVGCLYVRSGIKLRPQNIGGGHEQGRRSGTENIAGIVGLAKASDIAGKNMKRWAEKETRLRDLMIKGLLKIPDSRLNGHPRKRLPNNVNVAFSGIEGESMIVHLDMKGIAASTGSACSSKSLEPSHVLLAIGLKPADAHGSLRLSLGKGNKSEEVEYVIRELPVIVSNLRKISPFGKYE
jgi:cysteine desulfurase